MTEVTAHNKDNGAEANSGKSWLATGGILGALLASSCCIVPLVLISLGVSGAWIGNLTALEPYKTGLYWHRHHLSRGRVLAGLF